jgi:hypothetical protein
MSNFRLGDVQRWCPAFIKNKLPGIQDAQMWYLVCALICTGKISLQFSKTLNISYENGANFATVYKMLRNKSSVTTEAGIVNRKGT